jgi:hypothetical protein
VIGTNPVLPAGVATPALLASVGEQASVRFLEFFAVRRTRGARMRGPWGILAWHAGPGVPSIAAVQPLNVADLGRVTDADVFGADREAAARGDPASARLAGHGPDRAGESGGLGTRAQPLRENG